MLINNMKSIYLNLSHLLVCPTSNMKHYSYLLIFKQNSTIPEKPTPFGFTAEKVKIDEDYFFRPWKVQKELTDQAKVSAKEDPKFVEIATKNKEFLRELFILAGAKDEYQKNPYKAFWSSTHIFALLECESFWPKPNNKMALSRRIPINLRSKIEELACQVWDRRFLHSGCDVVMGAPLCLELFQVFIYSSHSSSSFSF